MARTELVDGIDWDDLRICLAVAEEGTLSAAGIRLGLSHTTLLRRIAALEGRLGMPLFHKRSNGYEVNEVGRPIVATAEQVRRQIADSLVGASGGGRTMEGMIRVAIPHVAATVFAEFFREFCEKHPGVQFVFEAAQRPQGLTQGETQVALTLTAAPPFGQLGTPLGPVAFAAYAAVSVLESRPPEDIPWIGLDRSLHFTPVGQIDRTICRTRPHVHYVDTLSVHHALVRSGLGAGLLACAVADQDPSLRRCGDIFMDPDQLFWLVHRRELRGTRRISAFVRHMRQALTRRQGLMGGEHPIYPPLPFPGLLPAEATGDDEGLAAPA